MLLSTVFDVAVPPARVFAYLSNPRNLIAANHQGPVVDQSDGPIGVGSWFVLAFDQPRMRVEYREYVPDRRIGVAVVWTGRGSTGMSSRQTFDLFGLDAGARTRIESTADGQGGWLRWGPLVRASQNASWGRMRKRIEADA